jgi:hypothetical protein
MKSFLSTGNVSLPDDCIVSTVYNYADTPINDGECVILDAANIDATKPLAAVKTTTSADSVAVCGVAKGSIPAATTQAGVTVPGIGQIVTYGFAKVRVAYGSAFAVGAYLGTSSVAGEAATGTPAINTHLGKVAIAKTLQTAAYNFVWAFIHLG